MWSTCTPLVIYWYIVFYLLAPPASDYHHTTSSLNIPHSSWCGLFVACLLGVHAICHIEGTDASNLQAIETLDFFFSSPQARSFSSRCPHKVHVKSTTRKKLCVGKLIFTFIESLYPAGLGWGIILIFSSKFSYKKDNFIQCSVFLLPQYR